MYVLKLTYIHPLHTHYNLRILDLNFADVAKYCLRLSGNSFLVNYLLDIYNALAHTTINNFGTRILMKTTCRCWYFLFNCYLHVHYD